MGDDRKQAAEQAKEQAQSERDQRETESKRWQAEQEAARQRHLDELFGTALANLHGDDDGAKAGAAVSLISFLKPEYANFHEQVFLVLRAMLKVLYTPPGPPLVKDAIKPLFVRAFELALSVLPPTSPIRTDTDLARMYLSRVNLPGLILYRADLGFCAMQGANLTEADLFRVRGFRVEWEGACLTKAHLGEARLKFANCRGANFHSSRLVAAVLKEADLRGADFRGAFLQSAHLEKAQLAGANFSGADLNDTYFQGASFDDVSLRSIALARNWQAKAASHFSADIIPLLEQARAAVERKRGKRSHRAS